MDMRDIRAIGTVRNTFGPKPIDPTPEEIRQRCLEIQAEWSAVTRSGRKKPDRPVDYSTVHRVLSEED